MEPGDIDHLVQSITMLMKNQELRKKKSNAAYGCAKSQFSLENHVQQVLCIYKELNDKNA